ncbi:MAG: GNAT family N-acetyltransferase [Planctomycetota bacterium]|jgi:GNAT superfamily N-acetyltransferase
MGEPANTPEVLTVVPPGPEWAKRLLGLYRLWDRANATGAWAADLVRRLAAPEGVSRPEGSHDRFYVSPHGEQAAAALDVSRSESWPGLGIVHRVFTHPTMRRKGLARALMSAAKRDFKGSRGRLLTVVGPSTGVARGFYLSQGFSEIVRAADGEALYGWAARGRHVREALLRFLKQEPVAWRPATPADWAALVAWSALPGGRPGHVPATLLDIEWIEAFDLLALPEGGFELEVAESRHGYVVDARASGEVPEWLAKVVAKGG